MVKTLISQGFFFILYLIPVLCFSQRTFILPDDLYNLHFQDIYKDQKIKEIQIYKKKVDQKDTSIFLTMHRFYDENGKLLEEKNIDTKRTILIFMDANGDPYRRISFLDGKKVNSTYYYFNRYKRIIATEIYDRLDSLTVTNYYNYSENGNEFKCIKSNSHGDTSMYEHMVYDGPKNIKYQRFIYPDKLACELSYVLNDENQISRKTHNDFLNEKFESWGFAYDDEGRRYIGETYNENRELTGTVEYFHDMKGLRKWEIYRDKGGRVQYELFYEYIRY